MIHTNRAQILRGRTFIPYRPAPRMTPTSPRSHQTLQPSQRTIHTNHQSSTLLLFMRLTTLISQLFRPTCPLKVDLHLHTVH